MALLWLILSLGLFAYQADGRPSSEIRAHNERLAIIRMCRRQLSMGSSHCRAVIKRWHYNSSAEECRPFGWTGCGGNDNRFESREECESQCQGIPPCQPSRPRPGPDDCTIFKAISITDGCPTYHFDCQDRPRNGTCGPVPDFAPLPKDCRSHTIKTLAGCPKEVITCSEK